ncbi:DUF2510 domain-containing protein [Microbacterium sp. NPDC091382]|uniref:DUF2510 domain-containing protein n=1 Tax=Microbacterium sp. NPDC091382 TaxID=3364210 RepID=UPI003824A0FE
MTRQAPAGWYADPGEPGQLRWWNGTEWATDTVAPQDAAPAPAAAPAPVPPPAPTSRTSRGGAGTVWIWLAIAAAVLPLYAEVFFDAGSLGRIEGLTPSGGITAGLVLLIALDLVLVAFAVLFAWLDRRALRRRGIEAPFAWVWAALAFVATLGVYVIGRSVVVHRRTGRGLAPVWVWLALTLVGLVVFAAWVTTFSDAAWNAVTTAR